MSTHTKPSFVFVHGIWADGSSFSKLIPTLRAERHEVIAAQYGPRHTRRRRRRSEAHAGAGQQPRHPRRPLGVACFAGDLSDQEQKLVWATHFAPAADLFNQKLDGTAWRSKPSWYIVANNDRTVRPERQRFVAKRMGATVYEVDTSHVPMLSEPSFVIDVIRTAANAVSSAATRTAWRQSNGAAHQN
jgi:pimeloyl-ACP methyl ester carboxylesterase